MASGLGRAPLRVTTFRVPKSRGLSNGGSIEEAHVVEGYPGIGSIIPLNEGLARSKAAQGCLIERVAEAGHDTIAGPQDSRLRQWIADGHHVVVVDHTGGAVVPCDGDAATGVGADGALVPLPLIEPEHSLARLIPLPLGVARAAGAGSIARTARTGSIARTAGTAGARSVAWTARTAGAAGAAGAPGTAPGTARTAPGTARTAGAAETSAGAARTAGATRTATGATGAAGAATGAAGASPGTARATGFGRRVAAGAATASNRLGSHHTGRSQAACRSDPACHQRALLQVAHAGPGRCISCIGWRIGR